MQFGIFSVGDVTTDPTDGRTPSEAERISAMTQYALKAEEVGLDVFATGEHHNVPFVPSSPTTLLGYIAAKTERLQLSTATVSTNDAGNGLAQAVLALSRMSDAEREQLGANGLACSRSEFDRATLLARLEQWLTETALTQPIQITGKKP